MNFTKTDDYGRSDVRMSEVRKVFWKTDEHVPFHDMRAIELAMKICEDFQPDILPAGSDGMDHYSISKYDKNPTRVKGASLQFEIDEWQKIERGWNSVARGAYRPFIEGNHEDRRRRWLWRHPEIEGLRVLEPRLLYGLDELGITIPVDNEFVVGDTLFWHGKRVSKHSAYTAKGELEDLSYVMNSFTGHTHRMGIYYKTTRRGLVYSVEGGCLCDLHPEYVSHPNWQQGVTLAWVGNEITTFEQVPFFRIGNRIIARWRDKEYRN